MLLAIMCTTNRHPINHYMKCSFYLYVRFRIFFPDCILYFVSLIIIFTMILFLFSFLITSNQKFHINQYFDTCCIRPLTDWRKAQRLLLFCSKYFEIFLHVWFGLTHQCRITTTLFEVLWFKISFICTKPIYQLKRKYKILNVFLYHRECFYISVIFLNQWGFDWLWHKEGTGGVTR